MSAWFFGSFFQAQGLEMCGWGGGAWGCRVNAARIFHPSRMHKMTNNGSCNKGCDLRVCFIALTYLIAKRGLSLIEPLICLKGMKAGKWELVRVGKNILSFTEKCDRSSGGFRFPGVSPTDRKVRQNNIVYFDCCWYCCVCDGELFCLWHSILPNKYLHNSAPMKITITCSSYFGIYDRLRGHAIVCHIIYDDAFARRYYMFFRNGTLAHMPRKNIYITLHRVRPWTLTGATENRDRRIYIFFYN